VVSFWSREEEWTFWGRERERNRKRRLDLTEGEGQMSNCGLKSSSGTAAGHHGFFLWVLTLYLDLQYGWRVMLDESP
jgi:hypothetical protein